MTSINQNTNPLLLAALEDILRTIPSPLREIELINILDAQYHEIFPKRSLSDSLILFQTHFVLFNALHHLKLQLIEQESGFLNIGPITIQLLPYHHITHSTYLTEPDNTSDYYLDWSNFSKTSKEQVDRLIWDFWETMGWQDQQDDSFKTLQLKYPCTWDQIKTQYRRLAMQHHPDRGGSKTELQKINDAYAKLKKVYKNRASD